MAKRRGFFAELNHQAQLAERRRQQEMKAAHRAQAAAHRAREQASRAAERARASAARMTAVEQKAAEKEAARLYLEARQAEVAEMNANLVRSRDDIEGMLATTLDVDDFVELEDLRITRVEHPPLDAGPLARPLPPPAPPQYPYRPVWQEPDAPRGLSAAFGGRKRHEDQVVQARSQFEENMSAWERHCAGLAAEYERKVAEHGKAETRRIQSLRAVRATYDAECKTREDEAATQNSDLDRLINELAFDMAWAIQEYVDIVLSQSVYPDAFPVEHDHRFNLDSRELDLTVRVPEPSRMDTVKEYKYVKAKDEITSTGLSVRDRKERYASALHQVALRSLHEIFEADRVGRIHSVALTVDTETLDAATGLVKNVPLVKVSADRETFNTFDLTNVVPAATLAHLGAAVSKNPLDLMPADTSRGVRARTV